MYFIDDIYTCDELSSHLTGQLIFIVYFILALLFELIVLLQIADRYVNLSWKFQLYR